MFAQNGPRTSSQNQIQGLKEPLLRVPKVRAWVVLGSQSHDSIRSVSLRSPELLPKSN